MIDDHEEVIATGAPREAGSAIVLSSDASVPAQLCIPLRLNEQHGTPGDLSFEQYIEQVIARRVRRTNARGRTA